MSELPEKSSDEKAFNDKQSSLLERQQHRKRRKEAQKTSAGMILDKAGDESGC